MQVMQQPPDSLDTLAKTIANSYDTAIRTPPSGDTFYKNFVIRSNPQILENWIKGVLRMQSFSPIPLPIVPQIAVGFTQYWASGVQLSMLRWPPATPIGPVVGAISNIVISPGIPPVVPLSTGAPQSEEQFVDALITAAKIHLATVAGILTVTVTTPAGPTPIPIPWIGYRVPDTKGNRVSLNDYISAMQVEPSEFRAKLQSDSEFEFTFKNIIRASREDVIAKINKLKDSYFSKKRALTLIVDTTPPITHDVSGIYDFARKSRELSRLGQVRKSYNTTQRKDLDFLYICDYIIEYRIRVQ